MWSLMAVSQIWEEGKFDSVRLGFHPPQVVTCIDDFKQSWGPLGDISLGSIL
jgi:hypothetical protein